MVKKYFPMIQKINLFLTRLFENEAKGIDLRRNVDKINEYNQLIRNEISPNFKSYTPKGFDHIVEWGILKPIKYPESDAFYKAFEGAQDSKERGIYKLSLYETEEYGEVVIAYVSFENPYKESIDKAFVISRTANDLFQILSEYSFKEDTFDWRYSAGVDFPNFPNIGELVEIERLKEPYDYEACMIEYRKDR